MKPLSRAFKAYQLLPLILLLKIQVSNALPRVKSGSSADSNDDPNSSQGPAYVPVDGIDNNAIYQISDGQIQAPVDHGPPGPPPYMLTRTLTAPDSWTTWHVTHTTTVEDCSTSTTPPAGTDSGIGLTSSFSTFILTGTGSDPGIGLTTSYSTFIPPGTSSDPGIGLTTSFSTFMPPPATNPPSTTAAVSVPSDVSVSTIPDESLTSLSTSQVQTVTASLAPVTSTTSSSITQLPTSVVATSAPFQTPTLTTATTNLSLVETATLSNVRPTQTANVTSIAASDIFRPIATDAPPSRIPSRADHPVPLLGIQQQNQRLQTNKFYANFFLGNQDQPSWTHPYSVSWGKGERRSGSWGLAVTHVERTQISTGAKDPTKDAGDWSRFGFPIAVESVVLSATELSNGTSLTTDSQEGFSVNVNLTPRGASGPLITFPLIQGMAFVTGVYRTATPLLQTGIGFSNLTYAGAVVNGTTYKYRATLQDGYQWLIYVTPSNAGYDQNSFTLRNAAYIQGPSRFAGYIQVAKIPGGSADAESVYDSSAGVYATSARISGSVEGTTGSYTLSWTKAGQTNRPLLIFSLPHHRASFSGPTSAGLTNITLITTTKGAATAVRGDSWTLTEPDLPVSMGFGPWSTQQGNIKALSTTAITAVQSAGASELSQNMTAQCNVGSLYYDGKALAKFATIIYTLYELANNRTLALTGLQQLQTEFARHINNEMQTPLAYDTRWGGLVSTGGYNGDLGSDFGNTVYNDHHFHYGYFVYAASVIGYLDPDWLTVGTNKAWVDSLVRDYANPTSTDPYFPFARNFDWFHGHSWAHGITASADGKDQESSSEDSLSLYAVKMWGKVTSNPALESLGTLQMAVQKRSLAHYYHYDSSSSSSSSDEPAQFAGNKVAGILFENKLDHTTYFGAEAEYIQGIHMLPLMPFSAYTRSQAFVRQEWEVYFGPRGLKPVETVQGGWRGVLMANLGLVEPRTGWEFFSGSGFEMGWLDGGASLTWYLALMAGLGGA